MDRVNQILRARLRCDVVLVVVTSDAGAANWASAPIATGHPGWVLTPLVQKQIDALAARDKVDPDEVVRRIRHAIADAHDLRAHAVVLLVPV